MTESLAPITPEHIDIDAMKVVRRLQRFKYEAYLVGGCVRDLLLGRTPKDFDVATSATPEQVKKTFRNCRIIGRRFRLAHIFFGRNIIETSTFRAPPEVDPEAEGEEAIIWRDNVFGTAEEDARRRDFTINGLFYDPVAGQVIDVVGGLEDLRAKQVRTIGDPRIRLQEDPVRILRAIKFATRLGLQIESATRQAMVEFRCLIAKCAVARVLEEIFRMLGSGHAVPSVRLTHELGVLAVLFPELAGLMPAPGDPLAGAPVAPIIWQPRPSPRSDEDKQAEDRCQKSARAHSAAVQRLYAELFGDPPQLERARDSFWAHLQQLDQHLAQASRPPQHAFLLASSMACLYTFTFAADMPSTEAYRMLENIIGTMADRLGVSKRDRQQLRMLLFAQRRMVVRGKRTRPRAMMERDYFRDALCLLEMSHRAVGWFAETLDFWHRLEQPQPNRRHRRRRRRRPPRGRNP